MFDLNVLFKTDKLLKKFYNAFFNRNWAGTCWGRWAGPRLLAGWFAGSWIVRDEVGLLQCWSAGSGQGTPLQKQGRMGVGEGFARGRSDA